MEIHQLRYALAVAKFNSFSLAADDCFVSQSTLSQQVAKLEKELGVELFVRNTRSVSTSEAGMEFVLQASTILRSMGELEQSMSDYQNLLRGTLNLGAINSLEKIDFCNMLTAFFAQYPNLNLNIVHRGSYELIEALRDHSVELAFLAVPDKNNCNDIYFESLGRDDYTMVVSSRHPFARMGTIDLAQASGERFIFQHADQAISETCMIACQQAGFTPKIVCRNRSTVITLQLVKAGLGIAFLPAEEIPNYRIDGVTSVRLNPPLYKNIAFAHLKGAQPSKLARRIIQFVKEWQKTANKQA